MTGPSPMKGTIPIQPQPIGTMVLELNGVTSITRIWNEGDPERCRLCPLCDAVRDVCAVMTEEYVSDADAPLYSSIDLDFGSDASLRRAPLGLAR